MKKLQQIPENRTINQQVKSPPPGDPNSTNNGNNSVNNNNNKPVDVQHEFVRSFINVSFPNQRFGLWRRRYAVLKGRHLLLSRTADDSMPMAVMDIIGSSCVSIEMEDLQSGYVCEIVFKNQTGRDPEPRLWLCCEEAEVLEKWLEAWEAAKSRIVEAAGSKDWQLVSALILDGHSVHTRSRFNGRNALHYAAGYGHLPTVKLLLDCGIDVNDSDLAGMTAIHWACRKGQTEVARLLLAAGGDAMARVRKGVLSGKMPLDLAREGRHAECADFILAYITTTSWWPHQAVMELLLAEEHLGMDDSIQIAPRDANEHNLPKVLSSLLIPFYAKDSEGRYIFANQPMLKLLGRPLELVVGRTASDFAINGVDNEGEVLFSQLAAAVANKGGGGGEGVVLGGAGGTAISPSSTAPTNSGNNNASGSGVGWFFQSLISSPNTTNNNNNNANNNNNNNASSSSNNSSNDSTTNDESSTTTSTTQPAISTDSAALAAILAASKAQFKVSKEEIIVDATGGVHTAEVKRAVLMGRDSRLLVIAVCHLRKECFSCGTEFNFLLGGLTRRHRCHNCFRCYCAKCSPNRIAVPKNGYRNPVRVCVECFVRLSAADGVNSSSAGGGGGGGVPASSSAIDIDNDGASVDFSYSRGGGSMSSIDMTAALNAATASSVSAGTGVSARLLFSHDDGTSVSLDDFIMHGVIGKGGFGKVIKVVDKRTKQVFALKTLQKQKLVKMRQVEHALEERRIMSRVRHPFIINMWYAFQTDSKLYMVLDYAPGGDLFYLLQRQTKCRLSEENARFAAAEVVLALEHLHGLGIVHRDLKPENILIDLQGHLRLADFGLSRSDVGYDSGYRHSMVGTPDYMAPEILLNSGHGCSVDWWSLGILIYEMLVGEPPFMGHNPKHTYENIKSAKTPFFPSYMSTEARDLTSKLLQRNPAMRPGSGHRGSDEIRMHTFFRAIPWDALLARQVTSPFQSMILPDSLDSETMQHPPRHNPDSNCAPMNDDGTMWEEFNH